MALNERWLWLLFGVLLLGLRNPFLFSLKLAILITTSKLYFCKQKWNFSPWLISPEFENSYWVFLFLWQYNYLHKFNKNLLFFNMTQLETLVILPRLWLECRVWECAWNYMWPDNLKELRLALWSQWSLLETVAWYLAYRIPSDFTRWVRKVTSWQVQKSHDIWGT